MTAPPRRARVIVASTRAARGTYADRTGPIITDWLTERAFTVTGVDVVADGDPVGAALREAAADRVDLILTTGGTGLGPADVTPEQTRPLLDRELPGVADAIRLSAWPRVPTAVLSRGVAGTIGATLVVNLPGSVGGVTDGLVVLEGIVDHALDQIAGGDH